MADRKLEQNLSLINEIKHRHDNAKFSVAVAEESASYYKEKPLNFIERAEKYIKSFVDKKEVQKADDFNEKMTQLYAKEQNEMLKEMIHEMERKVVSNKKIEQEKYEQAAAISEARGIAKETKKIHEADRKLDDLIDAVKRDDLDSIKIAARQYLQSTEIEGDLQDKYSKLLDDKLYLNDKNIIGKEVINVMHGIKVVINSIEQDGSGRGVYYDSSSKKWEPAKFDKFEEFRSTHVQKEIDKVLKNIEMHKESIEKKYTIDSFAKPSYQRHNTKMALREMGIHDYGAVDQEDLAARRERKLELNKIEKRENLIKARLERMKSNDGFIQRESIKLHR